MNTAPRSIPLIFSTIVLVLALTVAPGLMITKAFAGDDLLKTFDEAYAEISSKVENGRLDPEIGAKADELKIGLRKYLIKTDAQLEILELDVLHGSVENRRAALQKLLHLSAQREQIKMGYLQRLQALTESKEGLLPLLPVEPEQSSVKDPSTKEQTAKKKKDDEWWSTTFKDMEIIIEPEDLSKGDVP